MQYDQAIKSIEGKKEDDVSTEVKKAQCTTYTCVLHITQRIATVAVLIIVLVLVTHFNLSKAVYSYTYDDIWWIGGNDRSDSAGNVRIIYTYPLQANTHDKIDVGITLEYVQTLEQNSDWIAFPTIIPVLKEIYTNDTYYYDIGTGNTTSDIDEISTDDVSLDIVKVGGHYSKNATLTTPKDNGTYMFGIIFDSFFGPGSGAVSYRWDVTDYYNATWRDHGIIYPESESPPMKINNSNISRTNDPLIRIDFQDPYGRFDIADANVYNTADSANVMSNVNKSLDFPVEYGSSYTVQVPETIVMAENETRAIFQRWSDGYTSSVRNVTADKQVSEYYAIYRPQYYLDVRSDIGNTEGSGWYNASDKAGFSVSSLAGIWNLQSFDHWVGDVSGEIAISVPSGNIDMNGPKVLEAVWVHDLTYLGVISGVIGITTAVVGVGRYVWIRRRKKQ